MTATDVSDTLQMALKASGLTRVSVRHSTRMMRRKTKIAAVALANKMARMIRAIMFSGHPYREPEMRTA